MSFECPACHSENTNKLSMTYEAGLSNIKTRTTGLGVGVGRGGIGLGIGGGKTKGTTQTQESQRAAPPPKKRFIKPLALILIITVVVSLVVGKNHILQPVISIVWLLSSVGWIAWAVYYNTKQWPALKLIWDKSFICNRCGQVFQPYGN